jgi:hypothetical protein
MIWYAPDEDKANLQDTLLKSIKRGLENPDPETQKVFADMIEFASADDQVVLQEILLENIKRGLENPDAETQKAFAKMIRDVSQWEVSSLVNLCLENQNPAVQKASIEMIWRTSLSERQKLFELAVEKGWGKELIKPPLYAKNNINAETFSRQDFDKTGSKTTLVGGKLKDKTIIRSINPEAFVVWQRLYEDYRIWQDAGFDYVPIEPIQSYRLNNGLVDVYSGVLDLSLGSWEQRMKNMFVSELRDQLDKIIRVLDSLEINHGHTHDDNFCLRFFRDETGEPDFTRVPRLYLIDFDQASSPPKRKQN